MEEITQHKLEVGQRIKALRRDNRETQGELGEAVGVVQQSVAAWEAGRIYPAIESLVNISKHYGVPTDYILGLMRGKHSDKTWEDPLRTDLQLAYKLPQDFRDGVLALIRLERQGIAS